MTKYNKICGKAKVFEMRKPAEMMKLMTACFEDRRHKYEKEKLRDTCNLLSYSLFEVKNGQLNRRWNASHISLPRLGQNTIDTVIKT